MIRYKIKKYEKVTLTNQIIQEKYYLFPIVIRPIVIKPSPIFQNSSHNFFIFSLYFSFNHPLKSRI